jgi:pantoate--beta-alanine ligase
MKVIQTAGEMQAWALKQRRQGLRVGFVPTMGFLHAGHLSLVRLARDETDVTVMSIFVNPTQFGPTEDFSKYPRDEARDLEMCRSAGVDVVFLPPPSEMYATEASVYVVEESLGQNLCGASRPGHFRGVCTVVAKLFNLVMPEVAVFGQKDYQQVAIIRRMVRDLNFPVRIVVAPILRDCDGLALSSRNAYLSADERRRGLGLSQALRLAQESLAAGERDTAAVRGRMLARLEGDYGLRVDYVEIVDGDTLTPVDELRVGCVALIAAYSGKTRLIDNAILTGGR